MPGALILINGFPGIGKHTVAHELVKLLPGCKFFDTRNLIDAASQLYESNDPAHGLLRKNLKHAIFSSIAHMYGDLTPGGPVPPIYVLTDFLSVSARATDLGIMTEFISFARSSGFAFVHAILSASTDVNVARYTSAERADAGRPTDPAALVTTRMEEEVGHIAPCPGLSGEYELDTTGIDARTTAAMLAEYCLDTLRHEGWWIQLAAAARRPRPAGRASKSPGPTATHGRAGSAGTGGSRSSSRPPSRPASAAPFVPSAPAPRPVVITTKISAGDDDDSRAAAKAKSKGVPLSIAAAVTGGMKRGK